MKYNRIFLIVLDSVGIGNAKDADKYNDKGTNTLKNTVLNSKITLPNLTNIGLLNLIDLSNNKTNSYYTKANEQSIGKDTLTGHLEMMGIVTEKPFKVFTENGFPKELINELETRTNRKVIGNIDASGTEIIEKLGKQHMEEGSIIVYTSADSVLQIAAHEDIVPLEELYQICKIAREITLKDEWKVGRIIARPFIGTPGNFVRTSNRHDYALDPSGKTVLDFLKENHYDVIAIGKIADIFNNNGITKSIKTIDNLDGLNKILETIHTDFKGLCFANLNDFDSKYGHRRNVIGYGNCLKEVDDFIPNILNNLKDDDLLIITADHGNDPTYIGTDHTREQIPVIIYNNKLESPTSLEELNSFTQIGATILDNFNISNSLNDKSFLGKIK